MRDATIVIPVSALRRIFVMLLVLIGLILVIMVVRTQLFRAGISTLFAPGPMEIVDRNLQEQGDQWFTLTDVFYLSASEESGTQLIKRGSEPQGPKEPMLIPRAQILFIENLRDDSNIVTAITRFKSGQLPAATPPPATPAATTAAPSTARPSPSPSPTR